MSYNTAYNRLTAAGITCFVTMKNDSPVELLFVNYGEVDHWCNIDADGNIDADAAADIEELY